MSAPSRELVVGILGSHGHLDAMVNTVGGYAGGIKLWELETKTLEQMLALNLRAGYALSRAAVVPMLKQKHGCDRECRGQSCFRSWRGSRGVCGIEGGGGGDDGFIGGGCERKRRAGELDSAEHYRYGSKSEGNARS